ncbi:MAG: VWA domain-containing protein [Phycisphaeraceae bacterium]|nr:MAG: VWA domain-containing protein [Phycisphaeraceae bacterium]
MTFLAPGAALTAGLLAGAALLALYMLKLRRRPLRVSSIELWARAVEDLQVNVPLRWLRWSALLLLHALIAGCLVAAIGRPAFEAGGGVAGRVVVVIDRSASMSAADGDPAGRTRLDVARTRAAESIRAMARGGSGTTFSVVAFAAEAETIVGPTPDGEVAAVSALAVGPTDQPADLSRAMRLVSALTAGSSEDSETPTLVIVLSDGSFEQDGPVSVGAGDVRFVRCGPEREARALGGADNLGIVSLSARRDDRRPTTVRVFVRVLSASAEPRSTVLTLTVGGAEVAKRALTIPPGGEAGFATASTTIEFEWAGSGVVTVSTPGGDALPGDDAASLLISPAARPRVALVTPGGDPRGAGVTPESILIDVLSALDPTTLDVVSPAEYAAASTGPVGPLWDVVVFDRVTPATPPPVPSISLGAGVPSPGMGYRPAEAERATYVLSWRRAHPVLQDVAMDAVFVRRAGVLDDDAPPGVVDVARAAQGPLIRVSDGAGPRRVVVGFEVAQSNWALLPGFAIFMANAVDFVVGRSASDAGTGWTTSQPLDVRVPPGVGRLALRGPVSREVDVERRESPWVWSVGPMERAGVYEITASPGGSLGFFPVNLVDERESALLTADTASIGGREIRSDQRGAAPVEVWWWFVAAAGVLLIVEWVIFSAKSRV